MSLPGVDTPQPEGDQNERGESETRSPAHEHQYSDKPLLLGPDGKAIQESATGTDSREHEYRPEKTFWKKGPAFWQAVFSCLLVVTSIVQGCYMHRQWILTSSGLSKMGDQIWAAKDAAFASKEASDTAAQTLPQMQAQTAAQKEAASIARDSLVSVQRAFVFPGNVRIQTFGSAAEGITSFNLRFNWENSGTTPAKNVTVHISYGSMANGLPSTFSFPDMWPADGRRHTNTPTMIAPRGGIDSIVGPLGIDAFKKVKAHAERMYFWGWVRYYDVFSPKEHLTEMCVELTDVNGDILSTSPVMLEPVLTGCDTHNCYDEQCNNQGH